VLTNHHVLADAIADPGSPPGVQCVFDYHIRADSSTDFGMRVGLAPNWLVTSSPPSEVDTTAHPTGIPGPDQLDYALIRLADPTCGAPTSDGHPRGWFDLLAPAPALVPGLPLLVMQHPMENPIKLAVDTDGVLQVNDNATRVSYGVNTLAGSSGSPCLTFDMKLVALHHAGVKTIKRNEGIPVATIAQHLRAGGHAGTLGG
jgi:Trypsin-like peptidase domain